MGSDRSDADPVREFCRRRGCADHVVRGGLLGLLDNWERSISDVLEGWPGYLCEYLNDLDGRQIIHEGLAVARTDQLAEVAERLAEADEGLRRVTIAVEECLWGAENADRNGWSPGVNWWYYRRPKDYAFEW